MAWVDADSSPVVEQTPKGRWVEAPEVKWSDSLTDFTGAIGKYTSWIEKGLAIIDPTNIVKGGDVHQRIMQDFIDTTGDGVGGIVKAFPQMFKVAPIKLAGQITGFLDTFSSGIPGEVPDWYKPYQKESESPDARPLRQMTEELFDLANKEAPDFGKGTPEYYAYSVGMNALTNFPGIAASVYTGNLSLGLKIMSGQSAIEKKYELLKRGFPEWKANVIGGLYGAAEWIGEKTPLKILMKEKGLQAILKYTLYEPFGEMVTEGLQIATDYGVVNEDMTFNEAMNRVIDSGIMGALSAPITGAMGKGVGSIGQKVKAKKLSADVQNEVYQNLKDEGAQLTAPTRPQPIVRPDIIFEQIGNKVVAKRGDAVVGTYDGDRLTIPQLQEKDRVQIATGLLGFQTADITAEDASQSTEQVGGNIELLGEGNKVGTGQTYEEFISQVEEQPVNPVAKEEVQAIFIRQELTSEDLDTLGQYAKTFDIWTTFANAIDEVKGKPSQFWKKAGYVSARTFWEGHSKKASFTTSADFTDYSGFVNEDTGELIGDAYRTLDQIDLGNLLAKLDYMRKQPQDKKIIVGKAEWSFNKIKTYIRERTGQVRVDNMVSEMVALEAGLKKSERDSREAFRQGNKLGALTEHQKMFRMQEIKKNKMEFIKESKAGLKYLDGMAKNIEGMKNVDLAYRDVVKSILGYNGTALESFMQEQQNKESYLFIPQEQIDLFMETTREKLSLDELRNMVSIVKMLVYQGRNLRSIIRGNKAESLDNIINESVGEIKKNFDLDIAKSLYPSELQMQEKLGEPPMTRWQKIQKRLRNLSSIGLKAEYILERASGFIKHTSDSVIQREIAGRIVDSENKEISLELGDRPKREELFNLIKNSIDKIGVSYTVPGLDKTDGTPMVITKSKAISIALNSGHEDSRSKIRQYNNLTDDQIDLIVKSLNENEREYVRKMWAVLADKQEGLSEQYELLTGERMTKVEGVYYPEKPDFKDPRTDSIRDHSEDEDIFANHYDIASVARGMTISRRPKASYPIDLDSPFYGFQHLLATNHFIAFGVAVRDVNRIISDTVFKEAMLQSVGEGGYSQLKPWLYHVANGHYKGMQYIDTMLGFIKNNATVAILGLNVSTILLQPLALFQAVNRLEGNSIQQTSKMASALWDCYTNWDEMVQFVYDRAPWMQLRTEFVDNNITELKKRYEGKEGNISYLKLLALAPIGWTDKLASIPAWIAAYREAMSETDGDDIKSSEYATKFVRETQASSSPKDLPDVLRGTNAKKIFNMFFTFAASSYGEGMRVFDRAKMKQIGPMDIAKSFMLLNYIPSMIMALMKKREEIEWKDLALAPLSYSLSWVPYLNSISNSILEGYSYRPSPLANLPEAVKSMFQADDAVKKLKYGTLVAGYSLGIPSNQAIKTTNFLWEAMAEGEIDPFKLIYNQSNDKRR